MFFRNFRILRTLCFFGISEFSKISDFFGISEFSKFQIFFLSAASCGRDENSPVN